MKQFATITVIGRDKTGVIARVTNFLFEQHANVEALEEQVTRGQFSMTLQASWPKKNFDAAALRKGLDQLAGQLGMEIKIRLTETGRRQRFAIFVTKEPRCFETIAQAVAKKSLKADPALVIGNHASFESIVKKYKLPFVFMRWEDRASAELKVLKLLDEHEIDFVVLARFMKILSPNFVWRYKN
ncbi:MAG TPA: formyltransferase family protein, partial [Pseudomonadales bacterium]|nr:formyltransferase family protein [Pseudomonadales bacterium]